MISRIETQLRNKDMGLELTDNAKRYLAKKGYDPVLGARPLRRTIQREIEDNLLTVAATAYARFGDSCTAKPRGTADAAANPQRCSSPR